MSHSFQAFIDESGDDGLARYRQIGRQGGASHWLIISALIVRSAYQLECVAWRNEILRRTQSKQKHLHFVRLNHSQRIAAAEVLSNKPVRVIAILVAKQALQEGLFPQKNQLYSFAAAYLIERMSWLCRDLRRRVPEGDGRVKVTFSTRGGMSYPDFRAYLYRLQSSSDEKRRIHWPVIDIDGVNAHDHSRLAALQLADIAASSFSAAIDPDQYGNCEWRYASLIKPVVYNHAGQYLGYGVKFIPSIEECSLKPQQWELVRAFE